MVLLKALGGKPVFLIVDDEKELSEQDSDSEVGGNINIEMVASMKKAQQDELKPIYGYIPNNY